MQPDDHICVCNRVSLHKLRMFMDREQPVVPSQLSECLGAGTGCGWCIPFLKNLHAQWEHGETPDLPVSPEDYAKRRKSYHKSGERDAEAEEGR